VTLAACRLVRFGIEALLAGVYGRQILGWIESDLFEDVATGFILLAGVLTVVSLWRVSRSLHASGYGPGHRVRT